MPFLRRVRNWAEVRQDEQSLPSWERRKAIACNLQAFSSSKMLVWSNLWNKRPLFFFKSLIFADQCSVHEGTTCLHELARYWLDIRRGLWTDGFDGSRRCQEISHQPGREWPPHTRYKSVIKSVGPQTTPHISQGAIGHLTRRRSPPAQEDVSNCIQVSNQILSAVMYPYCLYLYPVSSPHRC